MSMVSLVRGNFFGMLSHPILMMLISVVKGKFNLFDHDSSKYFLCY